ncbi:MAG TPA: SIS domain-containing protein [Solirubrobacteraceae bacterium]|nr:SIS domain-containing protein [Solirubrobacteraceae bacterium]
MAERFARGGRLFAVATTSEARSDARHVAVEFVHPVIVGKRALPALALVDDPEELIIQAELLVRTQDIVFAFGPGTGAALAQAREQGAMTLAFRPDSGAEWEFSPRDEDPDVCQELVETLYHVLWELVHVFFEHRGLLSGRTARQQHDAGASAFLYPFLDEREKDLEAVMEDVRRSVLMKAEEIGELRESTLAQNAEALESAACALRDAFARGGKLLALGNGGSATDAMDVVADFRRAGRPAIDLTDDPGILTAIANDVGTEAIFLRQVIAYGQPGDVLLAFSTSGGSANVLAALAQARRRELATIAMVGYDGGPIARDRLADHVVVVASEHIPRIQEAQASAYHVLRELAS